MKNFLAFLLVFAVAICFELIILIVKTLIYKSDEEAAGISLAIFNAFILAEIIAEKIWG